jgi:hypothetical protein
VEFGGLPARGDKLLIQGGDKLAIKEDTVAAISLVHSEEAGRSLPAVLTSLEIEATDNGCGVFCKGKLVGVPFDSTDKPDKTGSLIPAPVIQRFLRGVQAGRGHDEVPSLGIYTQELESLALKAHAKVPAKASGVLVSRVLYGGSAEGLLEEGDVLTAVDGHAVDGEGSVNLEGTGRIPMSYLTVFRLPGEALSLSILRDGKPMQVRVPLKAGKGLVPYDEGERHPHLGLFQAHGAGPLLPWPGQQEPQAGGAHQPCAAAPHQHRLRQAERPHRGQGERPAHQRDGRPGAGLCQAPGRL